MKPKFNWKSIIPLALVLLAPIISPPLAKVGVVVAPAMVTPMLALAFPLSLGGSLLPLLQAGGTLLGGLYADGAFKLGRADFITNLTGILSALFVLIAAFGLHISPELQTSIATFFSALILYFSAHPLQPKLPS